MLVSILAQAVSATCPMPTPLPSELSVWTAPAVSTGTMLSPGRPARLGLSKRQTVAFVIAPGKPPPRGSFGGVYSFEANRGGKYRVVLSGKAWIDIVRDGVALTSAEHDHAPPCSGIAKMVTFTFKPGRYTLQLSGAVDHQIKIALLPSP
jgi:hypothetical protein